MKHSPLVDELVWQLFACKLPAPKLEYRFDTTRRWRFDCCWPAQKLAVECDGGTFSGGRHVTGTGFEKDCEKINAAIIQGWRVLRFTGAMIRDGSAITTIERALRE